MISRFFYQDIHKMCILQVRRTLSNFCTQAKILLNDRNKRGIYKLVAECKFLESYVDMKVLTEEITSKSDVRVRAVVRDVRKANNAASVRKKAFSVAKI